MCHNQHQWPDRWQRPPRDPKTIHTEMRSLHMILEVSIYAGLLQSHTHAFTITQPS